MRRDFLHTFSIKMLLAFVVVLCSYSTSYAQEDNASEKTIYTYHQDQYPTGFDNYMMATYYYNGRKVYNIRGYVASYSKDLISSLKINPSGTSYALLTENEDESKINIFDLWKAERLLGKVKKVENATAIAYTADARNLVVATPSEILVCDARTFEVLESFATPIVANKIVLSANNYYIAASNGSRLIVWNFDNKNIRKEFTYNANVNDMDFSDDSQRFAVLTDDGKLSIYNTNSYLEDRTYDAMGYALDCDFNTDGKYISVVCSGTRIAIINLLDETDRLFISEEQGGITEAHFVLDGHGKQFLMYNTAENLIYRKMVELTPNYSRLLADELDTKMNDWMKQMPDESLEDYRLRVNDETRVEQMKLYEQEIATRMADDIAINSLTDITLGSYNTESNMLSVNLGELPTIYLEVPSEDVGDFSNTEDLEFINVKYGLTSDDKFELIYADVRNKTTGKVYTYNNLERRSLELLELEEDFVPLEVIQQSNIQEVKLQEIKETVMAEAKEQNTISDHTNIAVKTRVDSTTNADGEKIMNFVTDVNYTVEKGFSAQEDFGPGKYKAEESGAAMSMLKIIKQALEGEFATYVKSGKRLIIKIHGMADAMPIHGKIAYDGSYGEYVGEPIYKGDIGSNTLSNLSLTKADGITQNEQLAFVRALGVKDYIAKNIEGLDTMDTDYSYYIEVTSGKGGEYRRISVQLIFVDAF